MKHSQNPATTEHYRPDIEGLRAIAVLAVIANHFNRNWAPSGYLGVDIFFVISGFVITSSLARSDSKTIKEFLISFYVRRVKRLLPALLVCIIISSLLTLVFVGNQQASIRTAIAAIFGVSNLYLLRQSTDYFAASAETNVFLHTWSLGVEEQFYLIFPLLFWFELKFLKNFRLFIVTICAVLVVSLFGFSYYYFSDNPIAYFLTLTRWWELGAGCLLVACKPRFWIPDSVASKLYSLLLPVLIILLFCPQRYGLIAAIMVVAVSAAIIALSTPNNVAFKVLTLKKIQYIGSISYSLYLWHWVVISLARWTMPTNLATAAFQGIIIFGVAIISYECVENPLRRHQWARHKTSVLAYGLAGSCVTAALLLTVSITLGKYIDIIHRSVNPAAFEDLKLVQYDLKCHLPGVEDPIASCLTKSNASKRHIFIIGDSHASNHVPSITEVSDKFGLFEVSYLVEWGFIQDLSGKDCRPPRNCIKDSLARHIAFFDRTLRPGDIVVFSWARDRVDQRGPLPREPDTAALSFLREKLGLLRTVIKNRNAILLLVDDIPKICDGSVVFEIDIAQRGNLDICKTTVEKSEEDRIGLTRLYKSIADNSVFYVDPHGELCKAGICSLGLEGASNLIYADASPHFLPSMSRLLVGFWERQLTMPSLNNANIWTPPQTPGPVDPGLAEVSEAPASASGRGDR